jgi:lysophospholipase L1-like esterase
MIAVRRIAICAVVMAVLLACAAGVYARPILGAGDRMVFLGDSITEQRIYTRYVMNFFTLRYPGTAFTFRNAGWGGDTAPGGLGRLQRDVLDLKPNVVSICFGMNDGGYTTFDKPAFEKYMTAMTSLVAELKKAGVKVVLLTPGCVHPEQAKGWVSAERMRPYNDTLALYAKGVEDLAARENLPVFDIHFLMLDVQTKALALDPKFTMIPDAIHPNPSGHAIMAYGLLKAMGCDEQPSGLKIDAGTSTVQADRCKVSGLKVSADSVRFTRTDAALPTYFDPDASATYRFFPVIQELDYYPLSITGLKAGNWKLTVQGMEVGTFSADDLAKGVNLATMPGPWQTVGEKVNQLSHEQEDFYFTRWRQISLVSVPKEASGEQQALISKMDKLIEARDRARAEATAKRDWQWTLTRVQ